MTPVTKKLLADFQIRKTKQQKAELPRLAVRRAGEGRLCAPGGDWRPLEQQ